MGTRHKVKVVKGNRTIINQYGQWDGYPTTAGLVIVKFLKDKENIEFLKNIKDKIEYKDETEQNKFIFGEMTLNPEKAFKEIYDYIYDREITFKDEKTGKEVNKWDLSTKQFVDELYKKFGFDMTAYYLMITRDTGYDVLDTIKELNRLEPNKNIPVFKSDYDGFDIEAKYTINLDKKTLKMEWHNRTRIYNLDNLPNNKEIKDFEEETKIIEREKIMYASQKDKESEKEV